MLSLLQAAWRARRVLLTGPADRSSRFMQAMLTELGARPARVPPDADSEILSRVLTESRVSCIIAPCMRSLCKGSLGTQLHTLDTLLSEAREAGVPLVMLLCDENVYRTPSLSQYAREEDPIGGHTPEGLIASILQLFADGVSRGLLGDAVSVLTVRHLPCLGCGHAAALPYTQWCHAILDGGIMEVSHPGMQGVFLHPPDVCSGALLLGARFLSGDNSMTGAFNLGVGPQNLSPNRSAALRLSRETGHARPIRESEPPHTGISPIPDGTRARMLCGAYTQTSCEEALRCLLELERAAREGYDAEERVIRAQTSAYLRQLLT